MKSTYNWKENWIKLFALFVIYMFMSAGVDVKAQNGDETPSFDANKPSTWDYTSNEVYTQIDPDDSRFDWSKADYTKVQWDKVNNWDKVDAAKLHQITDPIKVTIIMDQLIKEENREHLNLLSSEQLLQGNNLETVGDLNDLNPIELNFALIQKHGLPDDIVITVIEGVTYKNGRLINPLFRCTGPGCGIDLNSLKNSDPRVLAISAVGPTVDVPGLENGFVICKEGQACDTLIGKDIESINFDPDTGLLTVGFNDPDTGQPGTITIERGSGRFLATDTGFLFIGKEGAIVQWEGMEITAHGREGFETSLTFDVAERTVVMQGPGSISRGSDTIINQKIEGKGFFGEFTFKFGEERGDFSLSAEQAQVAVGEDIYSGSFSANYKNDKLNDFFLNRKDSTAQIRGHFLITNDDNIPKRYVTQFSADGKRIEQIWHNSAVLQTFNEEKTKIDKLTEEQVGEYISKTTKENDDKIKRVNQQLQDPKLTDVQKAQLETQRDELIKYNNQIKTITNKQGLLNTIDQTITRLEQDNQRIWSNLPNTGFIEYETTAKDIYQGKKTTDIIPVRIVILPGMSSYGVHRSSEGILNDKLSFSGLQDGVYSIYSPPEYSEESGKPGELVKRWFVYNQGGKEGIQGEFGVIRTKSTQGIIEVTTGRDTDQNAYIKVFRRGIITNNDPYAEGVIVAPSSKEPRTSMIRLDVDGIHAIDQLVGNEQSEVHTNPSIIKQITDNYKKVREIAAGTLAAVGKLTKEELEKIKAIFVERFEDIEGHIRETAKEIPAPILDNIIQINKFKTDQNIQELQNIIGDVSLNKQLRDYARQTLLFVHDIQGQTKTADELLNTWLTESPTDKSLLAIQKSRADQQRVTQTISGLTGKESIAELKKLPPAEQVYSRLSDLYRQAGDTENAQRYAELARRELTLTLERVEFDVQKAGFANIFDFSEKATEVNQRLAEASYVNQDYTLTEDASRFNLAIDKRNIRAQGTLSASLEQQKLFDENVRTWEKFRTENSEDIDLKAQSSLGLMRAHLLTDKEDKYVQVEKIYEEVIESAPEVYQKGLKEIYITSIGVQGQEQLEKERTATIAEEKSKALENAKKAFRKLWDKRAELELTKDQRADIIRLLGQISSTQGQRETNEFLQRQKQEDAIVWYGILIYDLEKADDQDKSAYVDLLVQEKEREVKIQVKKDIGEEIKEISQGLLDSKDNLIRSKAALELATYYKETEDKQKALEFATQATAEIANLEERTTTEKQLKASLLYNLGTVITGEERVKAFEDSAKLGDVRADFELAEIHEEQERYEEALNHLKKFYSEKETALTEIQKQGIQEKITILERASELQKIQIEEAFTPREIRRQRSAIEAKITEGALPREAVAKGLADIGKSTLELSKATAPDRNDVFEYINKLTIFNKDLKNEQVTEVITQLKERVTEIDSANTGRMEQEIQDTERLVEQNKKSLEEIGAISRFFIASEDKKGTDLEAKIQAANLKIASLEAEKDQYLQQSKLATLLIGETDKGVRNNILQEEGTTLSHEIREINTQISRLEQQNRILEEGYTTSEEYSQIETNSVQLERLKEQRATVQNRIQSTDQRTIFENPELATNEITSIRDQLNKINIKIAQYTSGQYEWTMGGIDVDAAELAATAVEQKAFLERRLEVLQNTREISQNPTITSEELINKRVQEKLSVIDQKIFQLEKDRDELYEANYNFLTGWVFGNKETEFEDKAAQIENLQQEKERILVQEKESLEASSSLEGLSLKQREKAIQARNMRIARVMGLGADVDKQVFDKYHDINTREVTGYVDDVISMGPVRGWYALFGDDDIQFNQEYAATKQQEAAIRAFAIAGYENLNLQQKEIIDSLGTRNLVEGDTFKGFQAPEKAISNVDSFRPHLTDKLINIKSFAVMGAVSRGIQAGTTTVQLATKGLQGFLGRQSVQFGERGLELTSKLLGLSAKTISGLETVGYYTGKIIGAPYALSNKLEGIAVSQIAKLGTRVGGLTGERIASRVGERIGFLGFEIGFEEGVLQNIPVYGPIADVAEVMYGGTVNVNSFFQTRKINALSENYLSDQGFTSVVVIDSIEQIDSMVKQSGLSAFPTSPILSPTGQLEGIRYTRQGQSLEIVVKESKRLQELQNNIIKDTGRVITNLKGNIGSVLTVPSAVNMDIIKEGLKQIPGIDSKSITVHPNGIITAERQIQEGVFEPVVIQPEGQQIEVITGVHSSFDSDILRAKSTDLLKASELGRILKDTNANTEVEKGDILFTTSTENQLVEEIRVRNVDMDTIENSMKESDKYENVERIEANLIRATHSRTGEIIIVNTGEIIQPGQQIVADAQVVATEEPSVVSEKTLVTEKGEFVTNIIINSDLEAFKRIVRNTEGAILREDIKTKDQEGKSLVKESFVYEQDGRTVIVTRNQFIVDSIDGVKVKTLSKSIKEAITQKLETDPEDYKLRLLINERAKDVGIDQATESLANELSHTLNSKSLTRSLIVLEAAGIINKGGEIISNFEHPIINAVSSEYQKAVTEFTEEQEIDLSESVEDAIFDTTEEISEQADKEVENKIIDAQETFTAQKEYNQRINQLREKQTLLANVEAEIQRLQAQAVIPLEQIRILQQEKASLESEIDNIKSESIEIELKLVSGAEVIKEFVPVEIPIPEEEITPLFPETPAFRVAARRIGDLTHGLYIKSARTIFVNPRASNPEFVNQLNRELLGPDIQPEEMIDFLLNHEAFHSLVDDLEIEIDANTEEILADTYARSLIGQDVDLSLFQEVLQTTPEELEKQLRFPIQIKQMSPEGRAQAQAALRAESPLVRILQAEVIPLTFIEQKMAAVSERIRLNHVARILDALDAGQPATIAREIVPQAEAADIAKIRVLTELRERKAIKDLEEKRIDAAQLSVITTNLRNIEFENIIDAMNTKETIEDIIVSVDEMLAFDQITPVLTPTQREELQKLSRLTKDAAEIGIDIETYQSELALLGISSEVDSRGTFRYRIKEAPDVPGVFISKTDVLAMVEKSLTPIEAVDLQALLAQDALETGLDVEAYQDELSRLRISASVFAIRGREVFRYRDQFGRFISRANVLEKVKQAVEEISEVPFEAIPLPAPPVAPLVAEIPEAEKLQLEDIEEQVGNRIVLDQTNTKTAFAEDIKQGQKILNLLAELEKLPPSKQEEKLYEAAIRDNNGALKIPVFENRVKKFTEGYTLYEVSMSREDMKTLNSESYNLGTEVKETQHKILRKFAEKKGILFATLQKTGYIAVQKGIEVTDKDISDLIESIENMPQLKNRNIKLRIGIADVAPGQLLMLAKLYSRRSLVQGQNIKYGNEVIGWYNQLSLEEKANANDIFRGYDPFLQLQFEDLESLYEQRQELDPDSRQYQRLKLLLQSLVQTDMQDANFNVLQIVKAYQSDSIRGVKEGDLVIEIDGVAVGQRNQEDVLKLTRQLEAGQTTEQIFAERLGKTIDNNIKQTNKKIKELHDKAVDKIQVNQATIEKYNTIAKATGFRTVQTAEDVRDFLKLEFENFGRFRGGDESFMTIRKEVLEANPNIEMDIQNEIQQCSECGYTIRIGSKKVVKDGAYKDEVQAADEATSISKENSNVPVRIDENGVINILENVLAKYTPAIPDITLEQANRIETLIRQTKARFKLECS